MWDHIVMWDHILMLNLLRIHSMTSLSFLCEAFVCPKFRPCPQLYCGFIFNAILICRHAFLPVRNWYSLTLICIINSMLMTSHRIVVIPKCLVMPRYNQRVQWRLTCSVPCSSYAILHTCVLYGCHSRGQPGSGIATRVAPSDDGVSLMAHTLNYR